MSFPSFYRLKPWEVSPDNKVQSCVCVYHRQAALYVKASNKCRRELHFSVKRKRSDAPSCQHQCSCSCACPVCVPGPWEKSNFLTPFMSTILCPRVDGSRHFKLACVLDKCPHCSWNKVQGACPMDQSRLDQDVDVKLLKTVMKDTPKGTTKAVKVECTERMEYREFMERMNKELRSFALHDFVARWQADMYHRSIRDLM